ncbi:hypothetical protein COCSUDRAFT_55045 [Coccomyxa subellipsoidea C-169]|uniref:Uncharacterized protein n=1 Tax=Coccomyxa subellipsoidea (strain C-169) TaxID=574566 RepID=I0YI22_COCSC|nr:hypothetical protein COCSUDRAFT_55045 [Coccomyxa subellipsoidea C-169]EIE18041.1 hypothetical protein COCSUDRAFT_55045 [Coccomyxa subellipsoidea C-169]|eukprot:XP_005642585.1 hypothetical protein COCSUDRAFT_55045 [Coccomyxa subellipsoidea C-169]
MEEGSTGCPDKEGEQAQQRAAKRAKLVPLPATRTTMEVVAAPRRKALTMLATSGVAVRARASAELNKHSGLWGQHLPILHSGGLPESHSWSK